jgi:hypothetical protein
MVNAIAAECYRIGNARGEFGPGMTVSEIDAAESALGISFAVDHRDLLLLGVPIAGPDWRHPESAEVAKSLSAPTEGALFDVRMNTLWPTSWGPRPADELSAESIAAIKIAEWPRMVPLWRHRCTRAGAPSGDPVFSIMQTDCVLYGENLADWARIEFGEGGVRTPAGFAWDSLLPWSAFAYGMENTDL